MIKKLITTHPTTGELKTKINEIIEHVNNQNLPNIKHIVACEFTDEEKSYIYNCLERAFRGYIPVEIKPLEIQKSILNKLKQ